LPKDGRATEAASLLDRLCDPRQGLAGGAFENAVRRLLAEARNEAGEVRRLSALLALLLRLRRRRVCWHDESNPAGDREETGAAHETFHELGLG
jgi:hypothetical protein